MDKYKSLQKRIERLEAGRSPDEIAMVLTEEIRQRRQQRGDDRPVPDGMTRDEAVSLFIQDQD